MCGFSVVIERKGASAPAGVLQAMNDAVAHRGPDAQGISVRGPVGLGHRRLSIIDLLHRADQPMTRGSGCIVYNGEIYNFREVRAELESMGKRFQTSSDTEVLVEALNTWWTDALPRLNGMFSFAYHDEGRTRSCWSVTASA